MDVSLMDKTNPCGFQMNAEWMESGLCEAGNETLWANGFSSM